MASTASNGCLSAACPTCMPGLWAGAAQGRLNTSGTSCCGTCRSTLELGSLGTIPRRYLGACRQPGGDLDRHSWLPGGRPSRQVSRQPNAAWGIALRGQEHHMLPACTGLSTSQRPRGYGSCGGANLSRGFLEVRPLRDGPPLLALTQEARGGFAIHCKRPRLPFPPQPTKVTTKRTVEGFARGFHLC